MAKIFQDIGKISFLIGILLITACTRTVAMSDDSKNYGELFAAIFKDEIVSMYIHPELDGRTPIQLITQGLFEGTLEGSALGSKIQFHPYTPKDSAFYLTKFLEENGEVSFELKYEVEGITIIGSAIKRFESWGIFNLLVVES